METTDRDALDMAIRDAQGGKDELLRMYVRQATTAEALLFAFLVTHAVVGLATAPDADKAILAAMASRSKGTDGDRRGRARARAAFCLVLPGHASDRDMHLWGAQGKENHVTVPTSLAEDVQAALGDVCLATADADLASLPKRLADMWDQHAAPRLSVVELRRAISSWAFPGGPDAPVTVGGEVERQLAASATQGKESEESDESEGSEERGEQSADVRASPPLCRRCDHFVQKGGGTHRQASL
jgi:hypothetical protein